MLQTDATTNEKAARIQQTSCEDLQVLRNKLAKEFLDTHRHIYFRSLVSFASAYLSYRQGKVGEASDRYTFWSNIIKAKEGEYQEESYLRTGISRQNLGDLIRPLLGSNGIINCADIQRNLNQASRLSNLIVESALKITDRHATAVLGNQYLAASLNIRGWNHFLISRKAINRYWQNIEWSGIHLGLFYGQDAIDCEARRRGIQVQLKVPASSIMAITADVRRLTLFSILESVEYMTPNDKAYLTLENANSP